MTKTVGFKIDSEGEKIVKRFKHALIRRYGKIHGVFSREILGLLEGYLQDGSHTHVPAKFTRFHRTLARIFFDLPNGAPFRASVIERLIEKDAGGHENTRRKYWRALEAWGLITYLAPNKFRRGDCPEWLREAYRGGE